MRKTSIIAGVLIAGCSPVAVAAGGDTTLPGLWEATTTDAEGETTVTKTCVAPGETLAASLQRQMGDGCRTTRNTLTGGRINVAATCTGGSSTLTGTYTPTTMNLVLKGTIKVEQSTFPLNLTVKARRIAASCRGGE